MMISHSCIVKEIIFILSFVLVTPFWRPRDQVGKPWRRSWIDLAHVLLCDLSLQKVTMFQMMALHSIDVICWFRMIYAIKCENEPKTLKIKGPPELERSLMKHVSYGLIGVKPYIRCCCSYSFLHFLLSTFEYFCNFQPSVSGHLWIQNQCLSWTEIYSRQCSPVLLYIISINNPFLITWDISDVCSHYSWGNLRHDRCYYGISHQLHISCTHLPKSNRCTQ